MNVLRCHGVLRRLGAPPLGTSGAWPGSLAGAGAPAVRLLSLVTSEDKKRVMFVCKRNSCRSQMAEGWAKAIAHDQLIIQSSGLEGSRVHPTAELVMGEVGVDITTHTSDYLSSFQPTQFDAVVSMCGCGTSLPPAWQKAPVFEDWDLEDPDGKPLDTFRRVRGEVKEHVESLVERVITGDSSAAPIPKARHHESSGEC